MVNTYILYEVLRNLGCLARAGLTLDNQDLMVSDGNKEVFSVRKYGQAASHFLDGLLLFFSLRELRFIILSAIRVRENINIKKQDNNKTKENNRILIVLIIGFLYQKKKMSQSRVLKKSYYMSLYHRTAEFLILITQEVLITLLEQLL